MSRHRAIRTARLAAGALLALLAAVLVFPTAGTSGGGDAGGGEQLYARYCISCHGVAGEGVAPSPATTGNPGGWDGSEVLSGPPLRGVGARAADLYLRTGYMPLVDPSAEPRRRAAGERLLTDEQIRVLVQYVAGLGDGPPVPTPHPERGSVAEGMRLFADHCAGCHQIVTRGGYVTGAVAPPLDDATAVQIAEAVRIGPYVMPSFPATAISARELDSIIAYVRASRDPRDPGGWGLGHLGPVPEGMVTWLIAMVALVATCVVIGSRARS